MIGGTTRAAVEPRGDPELGQGGPPARDRFRQQVDGGPVLDLGADRRRADDERDEREHGPDHQRVEDLGGVVATAAEADQEADQDRQCGEQDHEQGPPPARAGHAA